MAKKNELPVEVYIAYDHGHGEKFLLADESMEGLAPLVGEERFIGVYTFSYMMRVETLSNETDKEE